MCEVLFNVKVQGSLFLWTAKEKKDSAVWHHHLGCNFKHFYLILRTPSAALDYIRKQSVIPTVICLYTYVPPFCHFTIQNNCLQQRLWMLLEFWESLVGGQLQNGYHGRQDLPQNGFHGKPITTCQEISSQANFPVVWQLFQNGQSLQIQR